MYFAKKNFLWKFWLIAWVEARKKFSCKSKFWSRPSRDPCWFSHKFQTKAAPTFAHSSKNLFSHIEYYVQTLSKSKKYSFALSIPTINDEDLIRVRLPMRILFHDYKASGGGQNLERPNVERPTFRKFETSNVKITKVELFDLSIFDFLYFINLPSNLKFLEF